MKIIRVKAEIELTIWTEEDPITCKTVQDSSDWGRCAVLQIIDTEEVEEY